MGKLFPCLSPDLFSHLKKGASRELKDALSRYSEQAKKLRAYSGVYNHSSGESLLFENEIDEELLRALGEDADELGSAAERVIRAAWSERRYVPSPEEHEELTRFVHHLRMFHEHELDIDICPYPSVQLAREHATLLGTSLAGARTFLKGVAAAADPIEAGHFAVAVERLKDASKLVNKGKGGRYWFAYFRRFSTTKPPRRYLEDAIRILKACRKLQSEDRSTADPQLVQLTLELRRPDEVADPIEILEALLDDLYGEP